MCWESIETTPDGVAWIDDGAGRADSPVAQLIEHLKLNCLAGVSMLFQHIFCFDWSWALLGWATQFSRKKAMTNDIGCLSRHWNNIARNWNTCNILILKIRNVGGSINSRPGEDQQSSLQRWSTLLILGGIDDWHGEDQQSTFTFVWKGDHLCWSWGADQELMQRGSTVDFHLRMKRWSPLLILGGGRSIIDAERINSQCREGQVNVDRVNSQCREGQQSMWRGSSQLSLLHEKAIACVDPGGGADQWLTQRGPTVKFHFRMKRRLPLLILGGADQWSMRRGSTVNVERINSQLALPQEKVIAIFDWGGRTPPQTFRA